MTVTIAEYLASAKQRLLAHAIVVTFAILRVRVTPADGHWRVKLSLSDGSTLEFSEYLHLASSNRIEVFTYSYHWADAEDKLICRWITHRLSLASQAFPIISTMGQLITSALVNLWTSLSSSMRSLNVNRSPLES